VAAASVRVTQGGHALFLIDAPQHRQLQMMAAQKTGGSCSGNNSSQRAIIRVQTTQ
jgi:hypothetical protein